MIVYRFSGEQYKEDISGTGAGLFGGRWNSKGMPVVYASLHVSLSLLELLVHNQQYTSYKNPWLASISIPDDILSVTMHHQKLKSGWQTETAYTRWIGDQFLNGAGALMMQVPSSIIPQENNLLINPRHPDFKQISIQSAVLFPLDQRLFHQ